VPWEEPTGTDFGHLDACEGVQKKDVRDIISTSSSMIHDSHECPIAPSQNYQVNSKLVGLPLASS
jgi:hypothetical protein